jgi:hypothetical protein
LEHLEHSFHSLVQVKHIRTDGLLASEGEQLPGDFSGACSSVYYRFQVVMQRASGFTLSMANSA